MSQLKRDRKICVIFVLSIALVFSGYVMFFNIANRPEFCIGCDMPQSRTLVVGTSSGPSDLDPIHSWDSASNDIIEQVCEGLYQYDLSDRNLGIIPMLAADYGTWNPTATMLTVPLRQGVLFHDGTKFNASSVRWTFERINYFINASGMPWILNETRSKIHSLYEFPNGTTILNPVNPIIINSEYNVTINLRGPYAILESLLCYVSAYMLSPASTPQFELVSTAYGRIVGTGPFVYDYYVADTEVKMHRWDNYWRAPAFFEEVFFAVINDPTTRNNAILGHSIDYLIAPKPSFFPTFDASPTVTHQSDIQRLRYYYLGMNNKKINRTWRQAISHAINYSHIIEELRDGMVVRSDGPLAPGFPGYNASIKAATWDLAKARQILIEAGVPGTVGLIATNDTTGSIATAWKASDLATWNLTYSYDSELENRLFLKFYLDLIGIEVILRHMSFAEFINKVYGFGGSAGHDSLELFWFVGDAGYLSPFKMISPLFSNKSAFNAVQYYNHDVEMWLEQVLTEPNAATRQMLYTNILHQIVEVDMPHVFVYHPYRHSVHSADIYSVPYNSMGNLYIYPMVRGFS